MGASCCHSNPHEFHNEQEESRSLKFQALLTAFCLATLLIGHFGARLGLSLSTQAILFALAYASGGLFPAKGVIDDLRVLHFNVNFLMVFAALGAAAIGQWTEGATLMFLFSLSGTMESFASGRTRHAIRALMKLSPSVATVLRENQEKILPIASLVIGDILLVRPGERFAADGEILEGHTSVDESSITGESIPVDRGPGSRVMAGTINRFGVVKVKMDRATSDTTLARIFKIVEEAQQQKAPTQRLIEQYGGPYTALILISTLLTFLGGLYWKQEPWQTSLYRAMTLMVVASPCALVLSIPSAVLAAIAAGAWRGILFHGGRAVEIIGRVRAVAFDKTGTLTLGQPRLAEARYAEGVSPESALTDVASIQQNSEHPLAQVFLNEAKKRNLSIPRAIKARTVPGMGMEGELRGKLLRIGSEAFVCVHGGMESWVRDTLIEYRSRGLTSLVAATDKPLAVFGVSDTLRPGSSHAIQELKNMGVKSVMLSGDHPAAAAEIAKKLGLTEFYGGLLPDQKVVMLQNLIRRYKSVAMVGDGINDTPALVTAHVGIAMGGTGSDVVMENSDIVLMSDAIERVPDILRLGQQTRGIITQNLVFAIGVILLLILATFFEKLSLSLGVIGHEGSTVLVVFNSLRLLRWKETSYRKS